MPKVEKVHHFVQKIVIINFLITLPTYTVGR